MFVAVVILPLRWARMLFFEIFQTHMWRVSCAYACVDNRTTGTWKQSEPSAFSFTFSQLRHDVALGAGEIIVYDVYVRLYNEDTGAATPHNANGDSSSQTNDVTGDKKTPESVQTPSASPSSGVKVLDHPNQRVGFVTALVKAVQKCTEVSFTSVLNFLRAVWF